MPMTMTEKIFAVHCGKSEVRPGELVNAQLDLIMCHDVTTPPAVAMLKERGMNRVFDPKKVVVTPDHFVPNKDIKSAELAKELRSWVQEQGIEAYYELGRHGICHALLPEQGHVLPGTTIVGGDSHSCTYGAFGCFSTGIGSTDLAAALYAGELWFKVPESLKFVLNGHLPHGVYSKDIVLEVIRRVGLDGARYKAMEYAGQVLSELSMEARMTITNMAIEAGGKSGIIPVDDTTIEYVRERRPDAEFTVYESDPDAVYSDVIEIDVSQLEPMVAFPSLPSNGRSISEVEKGIRVDQVYIGSCTNARIEDLRIVAGIMRGHKIANGIRVIVVPATTDIWKEAMAEGLFSIFAEAGCVISTATCGACLGGYMGVLGAGEVCLSTTNRNFTGRMGHPTAQVYLASPATAAATAITGMITDPREFEK